MSLLLTQFSYLSLVFLQLIWITGAEYSGPITTAGLNLIKEFEGFRPNFYNDVAGIRTIGYGHACHVGNRCAGISAPISRETATTLLLNDLKVFEKCVRQNVRYRDLNAAQFSALTSFAFNVGCGSLRKSTLLRKLNSGNPREASQEFKNWVRADGRVIQGLVRRRRAEARLFCSSGGC